MTFLFIIAPNNTSFKNIIIGVPDFIMTFASNVLDHYCDDSLSGSVIYVLDDSVYPLMEYLIEELKNWHATNMKH